MKKCTNCKTENPSDASWCSQCGSEFNKPKPKPKKVFIKPSFRERNFFTSFIIILLIFINCCAYVVFLGMFFSGADVDEMPILFLLNILSLIMVLRWLRPGLFLYILSSSVLVYSIYENMFELPDDVSTVITIGISITVALLLGVIGLKRDGDSCWSLMSNWFEWKQNDTLYKLFLMLIAITVILIVGFSMGFGS